MKKRTLLLLLVVCLCTLLLPTRSYAENGIGTGDWTNGYGWWSQGQSTDWLMRKYGCLVVAQSEMLVESGVCSGDPGTFNPDVLHQWNINRNIYVDYYGNNVEVRNYEGPARYAGEIGRTLYYEGTTWSNFESKVWENISAGKFSILRHHVVNELGVTTESHYVLVNNGATQALGRIRVFESYWDASNAGTEDWNTSTAELLTYSLPPASQRPAPTTPYTSQSQYSTGSNVTVNWAASSGATSYYINVYRTDPNGSRTSYLSYRYTGGTSYTLTSLPEGNYDVYLEACSDVWSSDVRSCSFTVGGAAFEITNQPRSRTVSVGGSASFTVGATGDGLTYSWRYKAHKGGSWLTVTGGSSYNLRVTNVTPDMNGWQYFCIVTDGSGETLSSNTVTLTVSSQSEGGFAYAVVNGEAIVMGYSGADSQIAIPAALGGYPVTGVANNAFYNRSALTGVTFPEGVTYIGDYAFYKCTGLTGALTLPSTLTSVGTRAFCGCTGLTGALALPAGLTTVKEGAFLSCAGLTGNLALPASLTSLGASAFANCSGLTNATVPGSIQELYSSVFNGCTGLTGATLSEGVTTIRNDAFNGCTGLSSITLPASLTRIQGAFLNCTHLADVWYAGTQAQWNSIRIEKAPFSAYNAPLLNATLHFVIPPEIIMQPTDQAVAEGQKASFAVEVSGQGELVYQWYVKKTADGDWSTISAASAKTACYSLTTAARHNGYQYKCKVTADSGELWSEVATLTVSAAPKFTLQPVDQAVTEGQKASFAVEVSGADEVSYQWYVKKTANGDWSTISAASAKTACYSLTTAVRHNGYQYKCLVTADGSELWSEVATLSVGSAALTITAQPKSISVTAGKTASFTVAATGGAGELSYQWYVKKSANGDWSTISAASAKTACYSLTAQERHDGYQYRCAISDGTTKAFSGTATLSVGAAAVLTISAQPKDLNVTAGEMASFAVEASCGDEALSYQWYVKKSADGDWSAISAASAKTACYSLTAKDRHNGYQYRCAVSAGDARTYTAVATLTVKAAPSIVFTAQPANVAVAVGETAYFTVEANGAGALSYQWEYRTSSGGSWSAVSAASGKTDCYSLTAKERHNGYQYRCAVSDGTATVYSNVATLYVR